MLELLAVDRPLDCRGPLLRFRTSKFMHRLVGPLSQPLCLPLHILRSAFVLFLADISMRVLSHLVTTGFRYDMVHVRMPRRMLI